MTITDERPAPPGGRGRTRTGTVPTCGSWKRIPPDERKGTERRWSCSLPAQHDGDHDDGKGHRWKIREEGRRA